MDNTTLRPYVAADGMEMLAQQLGGLKGYPDADKWCKEADEDSKAFTVMYDGKMVACAGIITIMDGVGLAWALYPPNIGDYHIDPRIGKDKLKELIAKYKYRRVQATVRVDFPAGASYLRYMGFKREGTMKMYEPDKTDAFLYAITEKR